MAFLDSLLEEIGENENHKFGSLAQTLGLLVEEYESRNSPNISCSGVEALRYLMEEHQLVQKDLSFIGSQGVVSEILSGKRELNKRQVIELAHYFRISPVVFLQEQKQKRKAV